MGKLTMGFRRVDHAIADHGTEALADGGEEKDRAAAERVHEPRRCDGHAEL